MGEPRESSFEKKGVDEVFAEVVNNLPGTKYEHDESSGLTFYLVPLASEMEPKDAIDQVITGIRERGYEVDKDMIIDGEDYKYTLFATKEGNTLRWSCQRVYKKGAA